MKKLLLIAFTAVMLAACEKNDIQPQARTLPTVELLFAKWFRASSTGSVHNVRYSFNNNDSANVKNIRVQMANGDYMQFPQPAVRQGLNNQIFFMYNCQYCALQMKIIAIKKDNSTFETEWFEIEK